jgi:Ca2+-binding RTX toxin-like protein
MCAAVAMLLLAFAFAPAGAQAASVTLYSGGELAIDDSDPSTAGDNVLSIRRVSGSFEVTDTARVLQTAHPDCTGDGTSTVVCTSASTTAFVAAGDGADRVTVADGVIAVLDGQAGDDQLTGADGADNLLGGAGADKLFGGAGSDVLQGGPDNDLLRGGPDSDFLNLYPGDDPGDDDLDGEGGGDSLNGGPGADSMIDSGAAGKDEVHYGRGDHTAGVTVTLDGAANDGNEANDGRGDNVGYGIEQVVGSGFADTLTGGTGDDTLRGTAGDDLLTGGPGADTLVGGGQNDVLNARDGAADTLLDCDTSSPVQNEPDGANDIAQLDAVGVDPDAVRCEVVDRTQPPAESPTPDPGPGTGNPSPGPGASSPAPATSGPAPVNQSPPVILGRVLVGERVLCSPGVWTASPTFDYSWFTVAANGALQKRADGATYVPTDADADLRLECFVVAKANGKSDRAASAQVVVPKRVVVPVYKDMKFRFPNYLRGGVPCASKGFCGVEDVRTDLEKRKVNVTWKRPEAADLGEVPKGLRAKIRPGEVFETTPEANDKVASSGSTPLKVKVTYYLPEPERGCPIGEKIETKDGRDYTLNELLIGLSLKEAVATLKRYRCGADDYQVDYKYGARILDPKVRLAVTEKRGKRVQLVVDHPGPDLKLELRQPKTPAGVLPLALGESANDEVRLVRGTGQTSAFDVAVATKAGIGFVKATVELRDPAGDVVDTAKTDARGVARIEAKISATGRYQLWTQVTDPEGDALVGWKDISSAALTGPFVGLNGATFSLAKGKFATAASAARARASAVSDAAITQMRAQARTTFDAYLKLLDSGAFGAKFNTLVGEAVNNLGLFAYFGRTLEKSVDAGLVPSITTLGGSELLQALTPTVNTQNALVFDAASKQVHAQPKGAIQVRGGALGFTFASGVTLYPNGTYTVPGGGGNVFGAGGSATYTTVDASGRNLAIELVNGLPVVGIISGGAGNIISSDGASIISGGAGNIISGGGGNIISGGAGNIISSDGASIISGGAGNVLSNDGASIVAGGAGNFVPGG